MKQLSKKLIDSKVIACLSVALGLIIFVMVFEPTPILRVLVITLLFVTFFLIGWYLNRVPSIELSHNNSPKNEQVSIESVDQTHINFETMPVAIMRLGKDGSVLRSNKAARELLKIEEGEELYFSELVEGVGRSVSQWISNANQRQGWHKSEFGMARRQDGDVYLRIQLGVIDTSGTNHTTVVVSDATELKSLEAQFVQSQKMQAIGQLAGGIAHDFNNLLTAISGYCDLLMLRHEKGDADYGDLVQISSNANRAAALVGQLLAYSRKQTLKPSALQVNETLSELTHLLNRLVGETITLDLQREKDLPLAFVDGRQLEQVLMNLVVNARDAMPDGGKISLRSKTMVYQSDVRKSGAVILAGKYVSIEVEDEGGGIPKNLQGKIFEPFFSTKEVGKGTGLGLSMAYGIIKQTGGYIFADSEFGAGTLFTVLLPVAENMQLDAKPDIAPESRRITGLKGARVLLVEDEDPVRAVSQRALQSQGVNLQVASGGEEALEILANAEADFDVIVTDVVMPDVDGPTWVRRAQEHGTDARIIFVSGYAEESFSDDLATFNGAVFLPKPYSLQQLISMVSKMVEGGDI
jgi:two-component system cell cycle sensor histidine kinase/response regulator CckA